jgi:hypothetical protein
MRRLSLCVVSLFVFAACGHRAGPGPEMDGGLLADVTSLAITPANQTLTIAQGVAATSTYTVTGTFADGHTADVTDLVSLSVANISLGSFGTAGAFTTGTTNGGVTQVIAKAATLQASTGLTVVFQQTWTDPGSPGTPTGVFGGSADPARAPTLVYPNNGVVVPPNMQQLEFHFLPGPSNTAFALSLQNAVTDITVYLACTTPLNNGCIYKPDAQLWQWLTLTNAGGAPVTWSLQGTDATGTSVGTSTAMTLAFSNDQINGGFYYWTNTAEAIMRWDFASTTQTAPQQVVGTSLEGACIGCHALSHDGTKLVAEVNGQNDGRTALVDVGTQTVINSFGNTPKSMFESWNPTGTDYVGVYADSGATNYNLMILDGSSAELVSTIDVGGTSTHPTDHPDWSLDGSHIAYVSQGIAGTCQRFWNGSIYQVAATGSAAPQPLVMAASNLENNYYPAYGPDNRHLVFDHSVCTSGSSTGTECNADTNPTATLMMMDSVSVTTPIVMTNANAPGVADGSNTALTNSFPKWNPFIFNRSQTGGRLAWITFSSSRQYGLRTPPSGGVLLWMAAIDLDAPFTADPSSVAFALPFQDLTTSNHIAQWTDTTVPIE